MFRQVLVVRGAFAPAGQMARLAQDFPAAVFSFCDLATDKGHAVADFAARIDAHLDALPDPTIVVGVSLGGTIALALRSPKLAGVLALDPIIDTADCGPLWAAFAPRLADRSAFLWACFGLGAERCEPRSYLEAALGLQAPAVVLAGSQEPQPDGRMQGLISDQTLSALARNPRLRLHRVPSAGHDIGLGGSPEIRDALTDLLRGARCSG